MWGLFDAKVRLRRYRHYRPLGQWVRLQQLQMDSSSMVNIVAFTLRCIYVQRSSDWLTNTVESLNSCEQKFGKLLLLNYR